MASSTATPSKFTPRECLELEDLTIVDLVAITGLNINTLRNIVFGRSHAIMQRTADVFAEAFGLTRDDIEWSVGFARNGRQPLTGGTYAMTAPHKDEFCPTHHLLLPYTGRCDRCTA